MSVDFDMGLRQPVSLQHMLKGEKKKNSLFSGLADWPQDDILHKMPAMHKHGDKQKKLQCMYRRRSRQLTHSMRKILPVDIHTLHTTVCAYACVASQTRQMCQSFMTHCRLKKKKMFMPTASKASSSYSSEIPHTDTTLKSTPFPWHTV